MTHLKNPQWILRYVHFGFLAIIMLSWTNEVLEMPQRIIGGDTHPHWYESAMETVLVAMVWGAVYLATKRLLTRLHYLEGFLRVCAYCRKICHEEDWVPLEQYFARGFDIQTSHGICPACRAKVLSEAARAASECQSSEPSPRFSA